MDADTVMVLDGLAVGFLLGCVVITMFLVLPPGEGAGIALNCSQCVCKAVMP